MSALKIVSMTMMVMVLISVSAFCQGIISVDHIDGVVGGGVLVDTEVTFYLRLNNSTGSTVIGVANGFQIYSPDDVSWEPWVSVDTIFGGPPPATIFDTTYYVEWIEPVLGNFQWCCGVTTAIFDQTGSWAMAVPAFGSGADTIGMFGFKTGPGGGIGIPNNFSELVWLLRILPIHASNLGKTICLDSASYRNGPNPVPILWETGTGLVYPQWDGPHCFTLIDKCCWGTRGNINLDWQDTIDISDLTSLVGWMFKSGAAPPCMLEADVDGNGDHDIADVTALVGYMFKGGPAPLSCP